MSEESRRQNFDRQLSLEALLVEYQSLRHESLDAIGHRIQIVNFTFGAIALVIGGMSVSGVGPAAVAVVLLGPAPMLAFAGAFIWLGEHHRSQRAGRGMVIIEQSINRVIGEPGLISWETSLAARRPAAAPKRRGRDRRGGHMKYPYLAACLSLFGSGFLSQIVGAMALIQWQPVTDMATSMFPVEGGRRIVEIAWIILCCVAGDVWICRVWWRIWMSVNAPDKPRLD